MDIDLSLDLDFDSVPKELLPPSSRERDAVAAAVTIVLNPVHNSNAAIFIHPTYCKGANIGLTRVRVALDTECSIELPLSFHDIRRSREHGRQPVHRKDKLYSARALKGDDLAFARHLLYHLHFSRLDKLSKPGFANTCTVSDDMADLHAMMSKFIPYGSWSIMDVADGITTNKIGPVLHHEISVTGSVIYVTVPSMVVDKAIKSFTEVLKIPAKDIFMLNVVNRAMDHKPPPIEPCLSLTVKLRSPHQTTAFEETLSRILSGIDERCLYNEYRKQLYLMHKPAGSYIQMCPNSGKTIIGIALAVHLLNMQLVTKCLVLVHTHKLVERWISAVNSFAKSSRQYMPANVFFKVATIQSLQRGNTKLDPCDRHEQTLVLWDECHHIPADTFRRVMTEILPTSSYPIRIGLTGNMERTDGRSPVISMLLGGEPAYSLSALEMGRTLWRLVEYKLKYPLDYRDHHRVDHILTDCDARAIKNACADGDADADADANSDVSVDVTLPIHHRNSATERNYNHGKNTKRARWILTDLVRDALFTDNAAEEPRDFKHVMLLTLTIAQVEKLIQVYHQLVVVEGIPLPYVFALLVGSSESKRLNALIARINAGNTSISKNIDCTKKTLTIATMQAAGEGIDDGTIDVIVFADAALNMMQNGNRLRKPESGMIVYLTSQTLYGGSKVARKDLGVIRTHLFTNITHDECIHVTIPDDTDIDTNTNTETNKDAL